MVQIKIESTNEVSCFNSIQLRVLVNPLVYCSYDVQVWCKTNDVYRYIVSYIVALTVSPSKKLLVLNHQIKKSREPSLIFVKRQSGVKCVAQVILIVSDLVRNVKLMRQIKMRNWSGQNTGLFVDGQKLDDHFNVWPLNRVES